MIDPALRRTVAYQRQPNGVPIYCRGTKDEQRCGTLLGVYAILKGKVTVPCRVCGAVNTVDFDGSRFRHRITQA